jgi:hypothetical protein
MPRTTAGPALVDALPGSDDARRKAHILLQTIDGSITIQQAADALGCDRSFVHVLRRQALQGLVAALEPRTPGPKPRAVEDVLADQAEALRQAEQRVRDAETAMQLERVRAELQVGLGPRLKKNR